MHTCGRGECPICTSLWTFERKEAPMSTTGGNCLPRYLSASVCRDNPGVQGRDREGQQWVDIELCRQ